jgi:hypothetical protein
MGIDIEFAEFLLQSKVSGARLDRIMTLGRQNLFVGPKEIERLAEEHGCLKGFKPQGRAGGYGYADEYFRSLGATVVDSMDNSDYEGASFVHDANLPISIEMEEKYDIVCDAGSLEHIFNFPTAIANCMRMVAVGGRLILNTPANNLFGHGFYQFSPELLYRVLSEVNGFKVLRMVAVEYGFYRPWYAVSDPANTKARVTLTNAFPVYLFVEAERISSVPLFRTPPQQSDYVAAWDSSPPPITGHRSMRERTKDLLVNRLPRISKFLRGFQFSSLNKRFSFRNRRNFERIKK